MRRLIACLAPLLIATPVMAQTPPVTPAAQPQAAPYTGFKGGSEPGVINLTLLLQATDGSWYVATASWNDTTRAVDELRFVTLMTALVKSAGPQQ